MRYAQFFDHVILLNRGIQISLCYLSAMMLTKRIAKQPHILRLRFKNISGKVSRKNNRSLLLCSRDHNWFHTYIERNRSDQGFMFAWESTFFILNISRIYEDVRFIIQRCNEQDKKRK